jgi:AcrR family transcriptional regulator
VSIDGPGPRGRRDRPAKPALSRSGIVAAAVGLMRAEGLRRVTMRRLARELDTGAASLYVYVRNTAELHAAVLDERLSTVDLSPVAAAGDWRDRLIRVLLSYAGVLFDNPGLAATALATRPHGPGYQRLLEAVLTLLDEGGMPRDRSAWLLDLLLQYATATAAEHADTGDGADAAALDAARRSLADSAHPRLVAAGTELFAGTPAQRMDWAFRVLINGAANTPLPTVDDPEGTSS